MKKLQYCPIRQIVRIKPGGRVTLSPRFIKRSGWKVGDTVHLTVEGGRIFVERIPDERGWRIARLQLRTAATVPGHSSLMSIRTLGDLLALHRDRKSLRGRKISEEPMSPANTVKSDPDRSLGMRETLQERWQALEEENDRLFEGLAAYLEREHPDLVQEIKETLGDDVTALQIARSIRGDLFMVPGDAWRKDVKGRLLAAAFGICA